MLSLEIAILSEPGGRRYNEDACGHWHTDRALFAVLADGAGGHGGGEVAARLAVSELVGHLADAPTPDGPTLNALVRDVNDTLLQARVPGTASANMHTTVVCVVLDFVDGRVHWAHAGDSRLYWFRDGRIVDRTLDHSMVQSLVEAGLLAPQDLRRHPKRSELRSALGTEDDELLVDDSGAPRDVRAGDVFLLCTDGLWEYVEDDRMAALLAQAATPDEWLAALEAEVLDATRGLRSHDNFTAVALWTGDAGPG